MSVVLLCISFQFGYHHSYFLKDNSKYKVVEVSAQIYSLTSTAQGIFF